MKNPPAWPAADPLGEALHFLRMSGTLYSRAELSEPWGVQMPALPDCLMFHTVSSGQCWLEMDGMKPRLLQPGDLALVPHGRGHRLASTPGALAVDLFDLPREQLSERYELLRHGGGGAPSVLVCGAVQFDHPAARQLVGLLPRVLYGGPSAAPHADWLQATLRFMADEARELRPGGETVVTRLADIVVIQAIRQWMAQDPAAQTGWVGALRDRQIGRAIARIHRDPARPWSLADLAAEAAMSRSAFAARFTSLVGMPAMQYLTQWRMQVAQDWLQRTEANVAELAGRLGYQSEAAFSRAFKRFAGVPPGAVRRARVG